MIFLFPFGGICIRFLEGTLIYIFFVYVAAPCKGCQLNVKDDKLAPFRKACGTLSKVQVYKLFMALKHLTHESTPYRLANWACLEGHQECHLSSSGATSSMVGLHLWTHGSWEGAPTGGKKAHKNHGGDSVPFFLHEAKQRGKL